MGDSNLYSEQWHCYIPVVSKSHNCAKAAIRLACTNSSTGLQLDQAFCLKLSDPFLSQRVGSGNETSLGKDSVHAYFITNKFKTNELDISDSSRAGL